MSVTAEAALRSEYEEKISAFKKQLEELQQKSDISQKVQEELMLAIPAAARAAADKMAKEGATRQNTIVRATMAMQGLDMTSFSSDSREGRQMREAFRATLASLLPNIDPARVQIKLVRSNTK